MSKRVAAGILLLLVLFGLSQTSHGRERVKCDTSEGKVLSCAPNADCSRRLGINECKCHKGYIGDGLVACEYLPSNLINVAYKRPALQSSTDDELKYAASNAVDGNRNGDVKDKSCSQTKYTTNPWWRVDLGKSVWVEKVLIANQESPHHEKLDEKKKIRL
ncbi:fucolectin-4-like [Oculina patagonica]